MTGVNPVPEAVERFLGHYGLDRKNFPNKPSIRAGKGLSHSQMMEMDDEATIKYVKNYLRKAREEAHKPFLD